jgi:hypothetical protein
MPAPLQILLDWVTKPQTTVQKHSAPVVDALLGVTLTPTNTEFLATTYNYVGALTGSPDGNGLLQGTLSILAPGVHTDFVPTCLVRVGPNGEPRVALTFFNYLTNLTKAMNNLPDADPTFSETDNFFHLGFAYPETVSDGGFSYRITFELTLWAGVSALVSTIPFARMAAPANAKSAK